MVHRWRHMLAQSGCSVTWGVGAEMAARLALSAALSEVSACFFLLPFFRLARLTMPAGSGPLAGTSGAVAGAAYETSGAAAGAADEASGDAAGLADMSSSAAGALAGPLTAATLPPVVSVSGAASCRVF